MTFSRWWKATSHMPTVATVVACTPDETVIVPADRVVAADVRVRESDTLTLTSRTPTPESWMESARRVLDAAGITADVEVSWRAPFTHGYTNHIERAAALAVHSAVHQALEQPWNAHLATTHEAALGHVTGLAHGMIGTPRTGSTQRLRLITVQPSTDATHLLDLPAGDLPAGLDLTGVDGPAGLAAALVSCQSLMTEPIADLVHEVCLTSSDVLGIVGGTHPGQPLAVLLDPDPAYLTRVQHLARSISFHLAGTGWAAHTGLSAVPAACAYTFA